MMFRSISIMIALCIMAAAGVFQLKHSVASMRGELSNVESAMAEERRRIRLLQAEWAHLTRPGRLVAQAEGLGMIRTDARRIVSMQQIGRRSMVEMARHPVEIALPSGDDRLLLRIKPLKTFRID